MASIWNPASTLVLPIDCTKSGSITWNVTGTDYCKCSSQCVLGKQFVLIYLLLRFAYGGVLLMTAFLKIYPIPKIKNIPIHRLTVSQPLYRDAYRIARFLPIHRPSFKWLLGCSGRFEGSCLQP